MLSSPRVSKARAISRSRLELFPPVLGSGSHWESSRLVQLLAHPVPPSEALTAARKHKAQWFVVSCRYPQNPALDHSARFEIVWIPHSNFTPPHRPERRSAPSAGIAVQGAHPMLRYPRSY